MFYRKWIREIKEHTAGMDRGQMASYIAEYYWYHILLTFLAAFLIFLTIYNFTIGKQTVSLQCAIVNTGADDERDTDLAAWISEVTGIQADEITVDSNYSVSYGDNLQTDQKGSTDYTGYDKFFFAWANGELDAIVLPSSLLSYCLELGGELKSLTEEGEVSFALADSSISDRITDDAEDPLVIVFPENGRHADAGDLLLQLLTETAEDT